MTSDMLAIAQGRSALKQVNLHGAFTDGVGREVGIESRMAERMLRVAQRFEGKTDAVSHLSTTVLYELAARSTSDEVVEQVLAGELEPRATSIRQARGLATRQGLPAERIALRALRALEDLCNTAEDPPDSLASAILNTYGDPETVVEALVTLIDTAVEIVSAAVGGG
jgi:hypothetical protein